VGITLSGVVFESTSQGRRPLSGGHVWYFVAAQSAILGVHGSTSLDANGRYVISDLPNGHRVKVNAFVPQTLGQPCAARAAMTASSVLDIELVRPGARPTTNSSPTLSGVVFEMTAEGRRPLAGIPVGFYGDAFPGMVDVFTWTGTDGRYEFCNLPIGAGNLLAGDCLNDQMMSMPVEISGDMTKDFELTRLDCPR
jgi:hypothetical protein